MASNRTEKDLGLDAQQHGQGTEFQPGRNFGNTETLRQKSDLEVKKGSSDSQKQAVDHMLDTRSQEGLATEAGANVEITGRNFFSSLNEETKQVLLSNGITPDMTSNMVLLKLMNSSNISPMILEEVKDAVVNTVEPEL